MPIPPGPQETQFVAAPAPSPGGPPAVPQADNLWRALGVAAFAMGAYWLYGRLRRDPEVTEMLRMAEVLKADGAMVRVDLAGSPRPPTLRGHIPDVHALFEDGTELALEYENETSVLRTHARRQDRAFRSWERCSPRRLYAQVVVRSGRGGRS